MNFIYPVGSVVTLGVSTNPATLFGIGTWSAIAGRVIVGINTSIVGFDALNATGGEKTVTLTIDEIPEHGHDTITKGAVSNLGGSAGTQWRIDSTAESPSGLTGGGQEHENMPPFIVKYVWERVS